ncbi:helix-turn-helix domain-containing protein [Phytohabitans sp. LJ34]|uniref:helix-turn-helix domain-containing protein n=1 Tax=Phytohabitans sp. LJ34 TaxID=3452217 RepID=UPI003F8A9385
MLLQLDDPPTVAAVGVGVHGTTGPRDVFELPDLWQLHVYGYTAELTVGGTTHAIRPGRVSLIPPGARVEYRYRGRSEHLYAHFATRRRGVRHGVPAMQDAGAEARPISALLRQAIAARPGSPARVVASVWTVLWQVAQLAPHDGQPRGHATVSAAVAHIESHLAAPLTVPAVARAVGVSHNHLTRLFRAETGHTVVGYIRRRRLEHARHMLRESTLSIPAIAASVGIPDLQAFNKACRRELGASPRAVRA